MITASGAGTRHPDFTTFDSIAGKCFHVTGGSYAGKVYRCISAAGGTLNTDPLTFIEVQPRVLHLGKLNQMTGLVRKTSFANADDILIQDATSKDIEVASLSALKTWITTP